MNPLPETRFIENDLQLLTPHFTLQTGLQITMEVILLIPLDTFLRCVRENAERVKEYEKGHDGSDGKCDCIGLIIGALALAGFKWPGVHGSNWAARNAMSDFGYINYVPGMFLGEIVYKAREPGEDKYALPSQYNNSGDPRDYYHVGVVTGINPLEITHCTSVAGGIKRDNVLGAWRWGGKLKYVDYNEREETDMEVPYQAIATADSGKTVNLRQGPDKKSVIIARVPVGDTVTVLDELGEWDRVSYHGKIGYMMALYVWPVNEDEGEDQTEGDTVTVPRETLDTWADVLEEMARDIREKLGQG